jgi:anti-sigma28 factor (negative regulator of flagellin synthesis)
VQIDRDADDRDVRHHEREQQDLPPGKVEQSVGKKFKRGIQQGNLPVEAEKLAGCGRL